MGLPMQKKLSLYFGMRNATYLQLVNVDFEKHIESQT